MASSSAAYGTSDNDRGALGAQVTLQDARAWGVPSPDRRPRRRRKLGPSSIGAVRSVDRALRTSSACASVVPASVGRQAHHVGRRTARVERRDWSPVARTLDAVRAVTLSVGFFDLEAFAADPRRAAPARVPGFGDTAGPDDDLRRSALRRAGRRRVRTAHQGGDLAARARHARRHAHRLVTLRARTLRRRDGTSARCRALPRRARAAGATPSKERTSWDAPTCPSATRRSRRGRGAAYVVEKKLGDVLVLTPDVPPRRRTMRAAGGERRRQRRDVQAVRPHPPRRAPRFTAAMDEFSPGPTRCSSAARASIVPWQRRARGGRVLAYAQLASMSGEWLDGYLGAIGRGRGGAVLGHEVDAWVSWRPWPVLELVGGYSVFALGDAARAMLSAVENESVVAGGTVSPASLAHFGYLQATLRIPWRRRHKLYLRCVAPEGTHGAETWTTQRACLARDRDRDPRRGVRGCAGGREARGRCKPRRGE